MTRVVRAGGLVGFSARDLDGPQQQGRRQAVMCGGGPGFDWLFLSAESAAELCRQCGLACQRIYPVLMEPPDGRIEVAVRRHLEAAEVGRWRAGAWEMFAIPGKATAGNGCA
jgi:hypothetical protein